MGNKEKRQRQRERELRKAADIARDNSQGLDAGAQTSMGSPSSLPALPPEDRSLRSDDGDPLRLTGIRSGHQELPASSPLPPLTPSLQERSRIAEQSPRYRIDHARSGSSAERALVDARLSINADDSHRGRPSSISNNWRKATVRDETDDDGMTDKRSNAGREQGSPTRGELPSSSPYPGDGESVMGDRERLQRRLEKQRRNRAESLESAELREALRRSLPTESAPSGSEAEHRPHVWTDANLEAAPAALARKQGTEETTEEFHRRREALARSERRLRELRVEDDHILAEAIDSEQQLEAADAALAQALQSAELRRQAKLRASQSAAERAVAREEAEAAEMEKLAAERRALAERNKRTIQDHAASESERLQPPITVASRSSRGSPSATHRSATRSFLVAPSPKPSSKPATVPDTAPNPSERITHDFNSRVIIQKYRKDEIARQGFSGITDQNIAWTAEGVPYETGRAPSRGSSIGAGIRPRPLNEPTGDATKRTDANVNRQLPLGRETERNQGSSPW
ncbi:hypothetical protein DFH09DRAFT_1279631 [Mycena vulgaris]|nr:hypothetical protein DFH09DRAFT_1279631 [Mycena vulgaris]